MPLTYDPTATGFTGETVNNDAFYKVVAHGTYAGQANNLMAYYRVGLGALPGGLNFGGADILANLFYSEVWDGSLKDAYSTAYTLLDITVYPYNANFDLMYSSPFVLPVNEPGMNPTGVSGAATAATVTYNLEPTALGINGFKPPKRAYSSFGPTFEQDTDANGRYTTQFRAFVAQKFGKMADDLVSLLPPITYWPIRISTLYVAGVPVMRGFADIAKGDPIVRSPQTFRRSRVQEA